MAHARDRPADLHVARIIDFSEVTILFKLKVAGTFEKAGRAFALDDHPEMLRLAQIFESNLSVKHTFDRSNAGADRRSKSVVSGSFKPFATRNTALQNLRVNKGLIDAFPRSFELMTAFEFHCAFVFAA